MGRRARPRAFSAFLSGLSFDSGTQMLLISSLVNLVCRLVPARLAHGLHLRRLERWKNFEPEFYLFDHLVDPGRASVDVGGHEGLYAGRLAQLSPKVHCFEPIPWAADTLRIRLGDTVIVHRCALSNRNGDAELRVPFKESSEISGIATLETANGLPGSTRVQHLRCEVRRLDDVVQEPIGFIKIDVEGHELAVLEGARDILVKHQPILLIESERRHNRLAPDSVFEFLADLGYLGFFLLHGRPVALSAFGVETHQRFIGSEGTRLGYVNNFIFLPGSQAS